MRSAVDLADVDASAEKYDVVYAYCLIRGRARAPRLGRSAWILSPRYAFIPEFAFHMKRMYKLESPDANKGSLGARDLDM